VRILVGKTFGIGNAVLSIPMIKALSSLGQVSALVGSGPDDFGAAAVLSRVSCIRDLWIDNVPEGVPEFDVAVMSIPFDGRWQNGIHYKAKRVIDGRKRPGNVERLGFDMWEKHEVEYQMDNARELGYNGHTPDSDFLETPLREFDNDLVYVGIGFKRDEGGFGLSKHWGTDNFIFVMKRILELRPQTKFVSTGNIRDIMEVGGEIKRAIGTRYELKEGLSAAFSTIPRCAAYLGNDTGMMHVAASCGVPCYAFMLSEDLIRKNHPFGAAWKAQIIGKLDCGSALAESFIDFVWGEK